MPTNLLMTVLLCLPAQDPRPEQPQQPAPSVQALEWPREVVREGYRVIAYQPQGDSWDDYTTLRGRMAVEVRSENDPESRFGAVYLKATTHADFASRVVHVKDIEVERVEYPSAPVKMENVVKLVRDVFGRADLTVPLDSVLAGVVRGCKLQREVEVGMDPPPIYHRSTPAVLVEFIGRPRLAPLPDNDLQFAWNTNWDVVHDPKTSAYYVLVDDAWVTSPNGIRGPWTLAESLPLGMSGLPNDLNWARARQNVPGRRTGAIPEVLVTRRPAELVLTDGPPQLAPIPNTELSWVSNTEAELFWHQGRKSFYFTVAGRWFRAPKLEGPWTSASGELPADFERIPVGHPKEYVLVAVPGTTAAREAVIQCSIPRQARVVRGATVSVTYDGAPQFEKIAGTQVSYARNTRYDVFTVEGDDKAYLCFKAVWFTADSPTGSWSVCDEPPLALYSIPASHPKHHVTYVFVYNASADRLVVGYTAGYKGTFVSGGVPVFGAGYWTTPSGSDQDQTTKWLSYFPSYYWGYGAGAVYSFRDFGFVRARRGYGPHGGAGRGAIKDPGQRDWVRGDNAYGASGGLLASAGHNPWGAAYGERLQQSHGYASWEGAARTTERGWPQESAAVSGRKSQTEKPAAEKPAAQAERPAPRMQRSEQRGNNVFVGQDGNIYMRSKDEWKIWRDGGWAPYTPPADANPGAAANAESARAQAEYWQNLGRQQYARQKSAAGHQSLGPGNRPTEMPRNYLNRWWW